MSVLREKIGYQCLRKAEASLLLEIFNNYPKIFIDPQKITCDEHAIALTNTIDDERYTAPISFDFDYILKDLTDLDLKKLLTIQGRVQGFCQRFTDVAF